MTKNNSTAAEDTAKVKTPPHLMSVTSVNMQCGTIIKIVPVTNGFIVTYSDVPYTFATLPEALSHISYFLTGGK